VTPTNVQYVMMNKTCSKPLTAEHPTFNKYIPKFFEFVTHASLPHEAGIIGGPTPSYFIQGSPVGSFSLFRRGGN